MGKRKSREESNGIENESIIVERETERVRSLQGIYGTPRYPLGTSKKVLILIEDAGYAYNFYLSYLIRNYSISNADVVSAGGNTRFQEHLKDRLDYEQYIIIYDNGISLTDLSEIRDCMEWLHEQTSAEIHLFTPNCFEEILLSFKYLKDYVEKNSNTIAYQWYNELQDLMAGKIEEVDYFRMSGDASSAENKIEMALEELTCGTVLEYQHKDRKDKTKGKMSDCWVYECCNVDITQKRNEHLENMRNNCTPMDLHNEKNKLALIAENSLLGGLANIISDVFGYNTYHKLARMQRSAYETLVGRVK